MTNESAQHMQWPTLGKRYCDKMIHPSDGQAWKSFVAKHPVKAGNPRSVPVAISTDGFNPFGMSAAVYSCWPVFVIPLNLPWCLYETTEHVCVDGYPTTKIPGEEHKRVFGTVV
jgi:hypothetical protein